MTYTDMVNHDGKTVAPGVATFQAAAANADWQHAPGFYQILTDEPGAESWPITASTFILMHKQAADPAAAADALKFFDWAFKPTAPRWPKSSTTFRCPTRSSRSSRRPGRAT